VRSDEPTPTLPFNPESSHSVAGTARRIRSSLLILLVATRRRFATRTAPWSLPRGFSPATGIGMLSRLIRGREDLPDEASKVAGCASCADCNGSERREAPEAEVDSGNAGPDPSVERPGGAEPGADSVIPVDSAPQPVKKTQERRRKRRKTLPEPPVPTFIMVSPGRYVRAEEPAPLCNGTARGGGEEILDLKTEDSDPSPIIAAGESTLDVGEGHPDCGLGSSISTDDIVLEPEPQ
jgi:hypothetical protein